MSTIGPLVPADETFQHQITDTFATVSQADRSWTEKVCAMACGRDGGLQLGFGIGKYTNRGVMDAYAGVSRGAEQWTVRASRPLSPDPETTSVGPIRYEVLEPLRAIRFALDANEVVPVSFDWVFEGEVPPVLENREVHRSLDGYRLDADIVRYHHTGTARGWVSVDGVRTAFDHQTWVSTRDHSWGVRYMVGAPIGDVAARPQPDGLAMLILWCPVLCERPDGSHYALHWYYQSHSLGGWRRLEFQGGMESPGGAREMFVSLDPDLQFQDDNRRFLGGTLHFVTESGAQRPITLTPVSATGFHLGTGLYHGFDGHWHGEWRGPELHIEGEYLADCADPVVARRVHQHRDCVIRVDDPVGGGVGWGNLQSIAFGPHPSMGLTAEHSFL
jgi:hypothetical protein